MFFYFRLALRCTALTCTPFKIVKKIIIGASVFLWPATDRRSLYSHIEIGRPNFSINEIVRHNRIKGSLACERLFFLIKMLVFSRRCSKISGSYAYTHKKREMFRCLGLKRKRKNNYIFFCTISGLSAYIDFH